MAVLEGVLDPPCRAPKRRTPCPKAEAPFQLLNTALLLLVFTCSGEGREEAGEGEDHGSS